MNEYEIYTWHLSHRIEGICILSLIRKIENVSIYYILESYEINETLGILNKHANYGLRNGVHGTPYSWLT